jgi:hypothetical protein
MHLKLESGPIQSTHHCIRMCTKLPFFSFVSSNCATGTNQHNQSGWRVLYCTKIHVGYQDGYQSWTITQLFLKIKYPVIMYITIVLTSLKESNAHLKTCQVFVGSFMKLGDSLKFLNYSKPAVLWIWIVFKYPDPMVFLLWIFFPKTQKWRFFDFEFFSNT